MGQGASAAGAVPTPGTQVTSMAGKPVTYGQTIQGSPGFNGSQWGKVLGGNQPVTSDMAYGKNPGSMPSSSGYSEYKSFTNPYSPWYVDVPMETPEEWLKSQQRMLKESLFSKARQQINNLRS